jgi:hypothetical protein
MAYNKINLFKKIIEIQELTLKLYHYEGLYYKEIFHQYIKPKYHISYRTYHTYLGTNAKRELKKIQGDAPKENKDLFSECKHENKYIKTLETTVNCQTTAICCYDCGKQLTKAKTEC